MVAGFFWKEFAFLQVENACFWWSQSAFLSGTHSQLKYHIKSYGTIRLFRQFNTYTQIRKANKKVLAITSPFIYSHKLCLYSISFSHSIFLGPTFSPLTITIPKDSSYCCASLYWLGLSDKRDRGKEKRKT